MLLECHNCGAPLDVASGASIVKCNYCGHSEQIEKFRTVATETPKDFTPPREWTPKADSALPQQVLVFQPAVNAARAVFRALVFSGFMTVAVGGFIAWRVLGAVQQATGDSLATLAQTSGLQNALNGALALAGKAAGDQLPVVCSGNDTVTLQGKTLALPAGVPVEASGNCTIRLVGCTVSGTTAVIVKDNASVTAEGGSLTGKGPAVILSENGRFEATGGALLTGESTVTATGNATATLRGSSVVGRRVAIASTGNAHVNTDGAAVQGLVTGGHKKH